MPTLVYHSRHSPSAKTFTQEFTERQVELAGYIDKYTPGVGVPDHVALELVNKWNKQGGAVWKYWV